MAGAAKDSEPLKLCIIDGSGAKQGAERRFWFWMRASGHISMWNQRTKPTCRNWRNR